MMAKILTLDEMLEVLDLCGAEEKVSHYRWALELVGNQMAQDLAERLNVSAGPCTSDGLAFAGTCAPFYPGHEGQELPEEMEQFDPDGDWEPREYVGNLIAALANRES